MIRGLFAIDEDDDSLFGKMKQRAYLEATTLVQAMSPDMAFSVPRIQTFLKDLGNNLKTLLLLEEYETSKFGEFEAGELKGLRKLRKQFTPRAIKQFESVPDKTIEDIRKQVQKELEAGEITPSAVLPRIKDELKKLEKKQKEKRFELSKDEFLETIRERIKSKEITVQEALEETKEFGEKNVESFESDDEKSFIDKIVLHAKAIGTDPITAFHRIFTGETIRRLDNGTIIVERLPLKESQKIKRERGATKNLILDHTIPLQLGGSNAKSNLKLVPVEEWERYTIIENYLGDKLRNGDIKKKEAQKLIKQFKRGEITESDIIK